MPYVPWVIAQRCLARLVAGQERVVWNPALSIPANEFEFSDPEVARLKARGEPIGRAVWRGCCWPGGNEKSQP